MSVCVMLSNESKFKFDILYKIRLRMLGYGFQLYYAFDYLWITSELIRLLTCDAVNCNVKLIVAPRIEAQV